MRHQARQGKYASGRRLDVERGRMDRLISQLIVAARLALEDAEICSRTKVPNRGPHDVCGMAALLTLSSCMVAFGEVLVRHEENNWKWKERVSIRKSVERFHEEMQKVDPYDTWIRIDGCTSPRKYLEDLRNFLTHTLSIPVTSKLLPPGEDDDKTAPVAIFLGALVRVVSDTIENIARCYSHVIMKNFPTDRGPAVISTPQGSEGT